MQKTGRIQNLGRVKSTMPTEELSKEDLIKEIRDITGENEKEILELAQKDVTDHNLKLLLNYSII